MILADKIMNERKKNGWSQEDLAQRLDVSRQSVSKWESGQSVPDLSRILKLAELFGVSTDYLLKDDMEENAIEVITETSDFNYKMVSMEEASDFLRLKENLASKMALSVSMCVLSPVPLILMGGLADQLGNERLEEFAGIFGIIILLGIVAFAVFNFIQIGSQTKEFEYLKYERFETSYGVTGMVNEKKNNYQPIYTRFISIGVILCILCVIPLLIAGLLNNEIILVLCVGILLAIVSIAVFLFVKSGVIMGSYNQLLQEGDYNIREKKAAKKMETYDSIYWSLTTAFYLGWSFFTMDWHKTWIVWPVAGVLYAVYYSITRLVLKIDE